MHSRRLSLAPLTTPDLGAAAFVRVAAEAGFRHVALRLIGGDPVNPPADMAALVRSESEMAELRRVLDGEGVTVTEIEVLVIDHDTDIAASRPMLEAAASVGASELVVGIRDPDEGRAAERLAEAAGLARAHGLTTNLEFVPYTEARSLEVALRLIDRSGADVAVLVDMLHWGRSGGTVEAVAAVPAHRIRYLQLCDALAEGPQDVEGLIYQSREYRLDPGAGGLGVAALLDALPADLPLSLEVPNVERIARIGALAHARMVRAATEQLLEGVSHVL